MTAVETRCPVQTFAEGVISDDIPAGDLIRAACQRHLDDLEHGGKRGLWFDHDAAQRAIDFFGFLRHSKGEWAGQAFELSPWQQFIVGCVYGWKRDDGLRRFRTSWTEVPRKNGKSTLGAGLGIYGAFFDNEGGAEVYSAATKRDQAKIVWNEAKNMIRATPALKQRIKILANNLHSEQTVSKFEPLGADADSMDGLNPHHLLIDEVHAHKDRRMIDVLETATGARRQPLTWYITTAGWNRESVWFYLREYSTKVLQGVITDDTWFAFIATIDEGDDWTDPAAWAKANPNLGVSVKLEDLERKARRAAEIPSEQNAFKRLHLNVITQQHSVWLDMDVWNRNAEDPDPAVLREGPALGGLDLSSTTDLTAFLVVAFDEDGVLHVYPRFWIPEARVAERTRSGEAPFEAWIDQGYLDVCEGNMIDHDQIEEAIMMLGSDFDLQRVAYDRWNKGALPTHLMAQGLEMVEVSQGYSTMNAPAKALEGLLLEEKLRHGGHPVLAWMASNVAVKQDAGGNIMPARNQSTDRIDGIAALLMALGLALVHQDENASIYETRGMRFI